MPLSLSKILGTGPYLTVPRTCENEGRNDDSEHNDATDNIFALGMTVMLAPGL